MIDFGMLFALGTKLVELGMDGWIYWQKANATIDQATGKVDPDAYASLVADTDRLLGDLRRSADEARKS